MLEMTNLIGALAAIAFFILAIAVFAARLLGRVQYGARIGYAQIILVPCLIGMLLAAPGLKRPAIYYVQCGLMLAWLILELYLDYVARIDFRHSRWIVIIYVTMFFAGSGGMIGVASLAGRGWSIASIVLFLIMGILAFVQRAITGM